MASAGALQVREPASGQEPRDRSGLHHGRRRHSVGQEEKNKRLPSLWALITGKGKDKEEKTRKQHKTRSPHKIVHLHQHSWGEQQDVVPAAPEPPAAASLIPEDDALYYRYSSHPLPSALQRPTSLAHSWIGRTSLDTPPLPPRYEERIPPSRRNSQHHSNEQQAAVRRPSSALPRDTGHHLLHHDSEQAAPEANNALPSLQRSGSHRNIPATRFQTGSAMHDARENHQPTPRSYRYISERSRIPDEHQVQQENATLKEKLRVVNAELAEHKARLAGAINEAEVSNEDPTKRRSRHDSAYERSYQAPYVEDEHADMEDGYLSYYHHEQGLDGAEPANDDTNSTFEHRSHGNHVVFEEVDRRSAQTGGHMGNDTRVAAETSNATETGRRRPPRLDSRALPLNTAATRVPADSQEDSGRYQSVDPLTPYTTSNRASRVNTEQRTPPPSYPDVLPSRPHLGSPANPNAHDRWRLSQPLGMRDPPRASPPRRQTSTRDSRPSDRSRVPSSQPGNTYRSYLYEGSHGRSPVEEARDYIDQTRGPQRASVDSTNRASPRSMMKRSDRGSVNMRAQREADKGKSKVKDDDAIEEQSTIGRRDSRQRRRASERPTSFWV